MNIEAQTPERSGQSVLIDSAEVEMGVCLLRERLGKLLGIHSKLEDNAHEKNAHQPSYDFRNSNNRIPEGD